MVNLYQFFLQFDLNLKNPLRKLWPAIMCVDSDHLYGWRIVQCYSGLEKHRRVQHSVIGVEHIYADFRQKAAALEMPTMSIDNQFFH